ncbi:MAG: hypothetical protein J7J82_00745 [Staphylothermus sp.]|nr:hypothetical protein [Staphylothermus sp.]
MVDVEISGILEERLRRLVEIGLYSSLSEAVRDAIRRLLEQIDLKKIGLKLYFETDASFQYITELSDSTLDEMIEYFLMRGYTPLLGVETRNDVAVLDEENKYLLDPLTLYVMYKANILKYLVTLSRKKNIVFLVPETIRYYAETLFTNRLLDYLDFEKTLNYFEMPIISSRIQKSRLTKNEQAIIQYAIKHKNAAIISDDIKTRKYAEKYGVKAYSSISILYSVKDELEDPLTCIYMLKSIPLIIPPSVMEVFNIA